jgi:hypothetical protein
MLTIEFTNAEMNGSVPIPKPKQRRPFQLRPYSLRNSLLNHMTLIILFDPPKIGFQVMTNDEIHPSKERGHGGSLNGVFIVGGSICPKSGMENECYQ